MNKDLLAILIKAANKALSNNTRFHDFGHALEVLKNTQQILKFENGDEDILFTAALFHDVSNLSGKNEGVDGAEITSSILNKVESFPKNKIDDVCRLIKSLNGDTVNKDEIIINEADRMAIFSKLSIVRAFMIYGEKSIQPKEAIEDFLSFIERKYNNFKLLKAKDLSKENYLSIKKFLIESLSYYSLE